MATCQHCFRRFRSKAAAELAERRRAVILDLQGIAPAEHLRPAQEPDRRTRHIQHHKDWVAGLT